MGHFVLVHGACHGAWCWYKVKPVLESAGHQVTAIDLAASGINMAEIDEVHSMSNYSQPLIEFMDLLSLGETVTLVGHSLGGFSLAFAMDKFPHKISATVFLTALMPDSVHASSYVLDQCMEGIPPESWLDTQFSSDEDPAMPKTIMLFGPQFMALKAYPLSPSEDLALAEMLKRPAPLFKEDLLREKRFSEVGYGSVNRVYIICKKDLVITEDFQRWMIENNPPKEVMEIEEADHMVMFSKPNELCRCLLDIVTKYS